MTATPSSGKPLYRPHALVGAGLGLVLFLAVALLPALLYGGYAGVLLASGLAGAPVGSTFLVKALIVTGMAVTVLAVAAFFLVLGAAAGSAVGVLTDGASSRSHEGGR